MPACTFEYAVIRVVPRVDREEFLNVGVLVSCTEKQFLEARIEPDWERLAVLAPNLDRPLVERYLSLIPTVCEGGEGAGPIGRLPQRARFHWLVAPRSTIIQTSAVHSGMIDDPRNALDHIFDSMVRLPE